ncbi:MAG: GDSL-type esterase/lipase family protein, partial [Chloroflexota bacterium]
YRGNLTGIIAAFRQHTDAQVTLLTPTPVVETIVAENTDYQNMQMTWVNTDLAAFAEVVREIATTHNVPVVDLFAAFGESPSPDLYLLDGLHPNFAGQQEMLKTIAGTYLN